MTAKLSRSAAGSLAAAVPKFHHAPGKVRPLPRDIFAAQVALLISQLRATLSWVDSAKGNVRYETVFLVLSSY
jgi:hypothetical protein